jgi:monoamine oxidase
MTLGGFLRTLRAAPDEISAVRARLQGTFAVDLDLVALRSADAEDAFRAEPRTYLRAAAGNDSVAAALCDRLPDVRLEHRALRLRSGPDGVVVSGTSPAGPWSLTAAAAVLAVPPGPASRLELDPAMPPAQREALDALPMGVAAKLAVPTAGEPPLLSVQSVDLPFWCWTGRGAGGRVRAAVTSFAGSALAQRALRTQAGDASTWLSRVRQLVPEVALAGDEPLLKSWGDDELAGGSYSAVDNASYERATPVGSPVGLVAFAGEHVGAPLHHATMDAAVRSGELAADAVEIMLR